jgi:hypothetical protein
MVATINTIYKSFQPASLCITTSNIYTYYYNMHHWLKSLMENKYINWYIDQCFSFKNPKILIGLYILS